MGKRLTGARRYVLGLGRTNDAFGHGITELTDVFADGVEDVVLVFHLDSGERFSVVLYDAGVVLGRDSELFGTDPNEVQPVLRASIASDRVLPKVSGPAPHRDGCRRPT